MAEELNQKKEEALVQKLNAKKRLRGLLIALNVIVGVYLLYCIGSLAYHLLNPVAPQAEMTLCGYQKAESDKLFAKYASETFDGDFATYGNQWSVVEGPYGKQKERIANLQAVPVCSAKYSKNLNYQQTVSFDEMMSLEKDQDGQWLEEGDDLFLKDYVDQSNVGKALRVKDLQEKIEMTHYSLPMENGKRVKTTLIADPDLPSFVMRVEHVEELPTDYFDLVIWKRKSDLNIMEITAQIPDNIKVKTLNEQATMQDCLLVSSTYIASIDEGEAKICISEMLQKEYTGMVKEDTPFIRAMAGYAYKDNEEDPSSYISTRYMGKMTYDILLPKETPPVTE